MLTKQIVGDDGTACGLGFYLGRRRRESRYLHLGYFDGVDHQVEGLLGRRPAVAHLPHGDPGRRTGRSTARPPPPPPPEPPAARAPTTPANPPTLAYAYRPSRRARERAAAAQPHGLVRLRQADPEEEPFWATLTALEGN